MTTLATATPLRLDQPDTIFRCTITDDDGTVVDVSAATIAIVFRSPSGVDVAETAALTSGGTDGIIEFADALAAYTNAVGTWKYWGRATMGTDGPFPSTTLSYRVKTEGDE